MNALTWPAVLAVLLMPAAAAAQDRPAARAEARPATDPGAATAPLVHRSALSSYRRSGGEDPPATAWREANDTVGRIGGWRAYAREAQADAGHAHHHAAPATPASAPRR